MLGWGASALQLRMAAVKGGSPLIGPRSPQNGPRKDPRKRTKDQEECKFWIKFEFRWVGKVLDCFNYCLSAYLPVNLCMYSCTRALFTLEKAPG